MKTILVPTDFSDNAASALHYAAGLASALRARLIVAHIINIPVNLPAYPEARPDLIADPRLQEEAEVALIKLARETRLEDGFLFDLHTVCRTGALLPTLNDLIETESVDLVVMGTKGASDFLGKLLGTNTSLFMKVATCPVLAVPPQARFTGFRQLAYAADLENDETVFLQQLFYMAASFGAEVSIVHVQTERQLDIIPDDQLLQDIHRTFAGRPYSLVQLKEDNVVDALETFARQKGLDLLAVGIQHRNLLEDLFHKSITKQLVYNLSLPLLALPAKPHQQLLKKISALMKKDPDSLTWSH